MTIGLIGRKSGMTRVFSDDGVATPVTVIEVAPNKVSIIKTLERDGYSAVQLAAVEKRASLVNKPAAGHLAAAGVAPARYMNEFRVDEKAAADFKIGDELTVARFEAGQKVDVSGVTKGKGFAGGVKRWNFAMQDATHGNSLAHRAPGSIGQNQTPGRVFKGKKMAGHMGDENMTVQSLEIVRVDEERNLILVKGAVPGAPGGKVIVRPAVKVKA